MINVVSPLFVCVWAIERGEVLPTYSFNQLDKSDDVSLIRRGQWAVGGAFRGTGGNKICFDSFEEGENVQRHEKKNAAEKESSRRSGGREGVL